MIAKEGAYRWRGGTQDFVPLASPGDPQVTASLDLRRMAPGMDMGASPVALLKMGEGSTMIGTFGQGVFTQAGAGTYQPASDGLESQLVTGLARGEDDTIYASTVGGGLHRARLPTVRWERLAQPDLPLLSSVGCAGGVIFVGTPSGLQSSIDGGLTFKEVPQIRGFVTTIALSTAGDLLVGTWGHGLFRRRSADGRFEAVDIADEKNRATAISAVNGGVLVGNGRGEVYHFREERDQWERVGGVWPEVPVEQISEGPDHRIYVGTSAGIFVLRDDGFDRVLTGASGSFTVTEAGVLTARNIDQRVVVNLIPPSGPARTPVFHVDIGSLVALGGLAREPGGRVVMLDAVPPLVSTDGGRSFKLGGPKILNARWSFQGPVLVGPQHTFLLLPERDQLYLAKSGAPFRRAILDIPVGHCVAVLEDHSVVSISNKRLYRAPPGGKRAARESSIVPSCAAVARLPGGLVVLLEESGRAIHQTRDFVKFQRVALWGQRDDGGSSLPAKARGGDR